MESRILKYSSLVWNILSKIGENFPDGRFPEEGQKALSLLWTPPLRFLFRSAGIVVWRSVLTLRIRLVGQRPFLMMKIIKTIAISWLFEYTICNRVARSLFGIGDQAETCAQLFYVKERFYGFEKAIDF